MVEHFDEIHSFFLKNHIKLKKDWLREAITFLSNVGKNTNELINLVYHQWLYTDIGQSVDTPPNWLGLQSNVKQLSSHCVYQIQSIADIGTPRLKQFRRLTDADYDESAAELGTNEHFDNLNMNKGQKCYYLKLTADGQSEFKAFEKMRIPQLSMATSPGSKILILAGTKIQQGVFFLLPANCQFLGGAVESLMQENNILKQLSDQLNKPIPIKGIQPPAKQPPNKPQNVALPPPPMATNNDWPPAPHAGNFPAPQYPGPSRLPLSSSTNPSSSSLQRLGGILKPINRNPPPAPPNFQQQQIPTVNPPPQQHQRMAPVPAPKPPMVVHPNPPPLPQPRQFFTTAAKQFPPFQPPQQQQRLPPPPHHHQQQQMPITIFTTAAIKQEPAGGGGGRQGEPASSTHQHPHQQPQQPFPAPVTTSECESTTSSTATTSATSIQPQQQKSEQREGGGGRALIDARVVRHYKALGVQTLAAVRRKMDFSVGYKQFIVIAFVGEVASPFRIVDNNKWGMSVALMDESSETPLVCDMAHELLLNLTMMTTKEAQEIKTSGNEERKKEGALRLKLMQEQLMRLDLVFDIEALCCRGAKAPVIKRMTTLGERLGFV